jgi:hypothetical protein
MDHAFSSVKGENPMSDFTRISKPESSEKMYPSEEASLAKKSKSFEDPDEVRPFVSHGHLDVLNFQDGVTIGRALFEPGWKWSQDVKPIAGTSSCQAPHSGYCLEGSMTVKMDDGNRIELKAGDAFHIPPGHDAWVEGDRRCVLIDVGGYADYAKPAKNGMAKH